MSESLNLSGLWMGSYAYAFGGAVPFLAKIEDRDGALSGTIIEPNTMGESSDSLEAILQGSRHGRAVDFTKAYDGASDAAHAVDYVGRLSGTAPASPACGAWRTSTAASKCIGRRSGKKPKGAKRKLSALAETRAYCLAGHCRRGP
ncbi:MAG TPA: hypothetical protein VGB65_06240 [Allosphingosinicella sp.]|jgi:hypothetical protein